MVDQPQSGPEQSPPPQETGIEIPPADPLPTHDSTLTRKPRARKRSPLLIAGAVILGLLVILAVCLIGFFTIGKQFNIAGLFSPPLSQSFTNDQIGLTIRYPKDWVVNDGLQVVTLASSNKIIQSSSNTFGEFATNLGKDGAYFALFRVPISDLDLPTEVDRTAPDQILDNFLTQGGLLTGIESIKIGTINPTKFASYPAATSASSFNEAGIPGKVYLALVLTEDSIILVMGASHDEGWRQNKIIFDSMMNSMEFTPLTFGQ